MPRAQRVEPRLALRSQLQSLGGAAEQHDTQRILKRADLLPDRGGRDRELVGGAREREMPRRGVEHAQAVEGQVGALHTPTAGAVSAKRGMSTSNADPSSAIT